MPMHISPRITTLEETIRKISEAAAKIPGCIRFDIGQPDFRTPEHIRDAAFRAMNGKNIGYTSMLGIAELRKAISDYENKKGLNLAAENIMVTNGGAGALFNVFLGLLERGDEVLLPDPSWSPYELMIRSVGGVPKYARFFDGDKVIADSIVRAITPKTKAMIVNSPENPTGRVASMNDLKTIAEIAKDSKITLISDEVYDKILFGNAKHFSPAKFAPENTIVVNSMSKSYSMTGWRLGWLAAPKETVKEIAMCNRVTTGCPNAVSQYAALAALEGNQECVEDMRKEYEKRRDTAVRCMKKIGWNFVLPEGAFYAFPKVGGDSWKFARDMLERAKVAVVPGASFGPSGEGYIRLCFGSVNSDGINEGFGRMEEVM